MNDIFTIKKCKYNLQGSSLINRSTVLTTNHGLKSFKDWEAKIWNLLPQSCKAATSLDKFKVLIKSWNGPKCSCSVCLHFTWIWLYPQALCIILYYITLSFYYFVVCRILWRNSKLPTYLSTTLFCHIFTYFGVITGIVWLYMDKIWLHIHVVHV